MPTNEQITQAISDKEVKLFTLFLVQKRRINLEIKDIIEEQYGLSAFPEKTSEAMAYVQFQMNNAPTYSPTQGFVSGTMFPSLNKPFYGSKCGAQSD